MSRHIIVKIGYIGTAYEGFQKQKHTKNTIQSVVEEALSGVFQENVKVIGASRTDRGVHALAQMIQFKELKPIEQDKYVYILNNALPKDIRAYKSYAINENEDFHIQYSSVKKRYKYLIDNNRVPILTQIPFALHYPYKLNIDRMKAGIKLIRGKHDFSAYASRYSAVENCIRNIFLAELEEKTNGIIEICIEGDGFLHNMVRIIVGTLLDIGRNTYEPEIFNKAFLSKDRKDLGKTAKAKGLILENVYYREEFLND
ncbi:MAG: tRNA pseudouridine(38-40) synthase TruA [Fusobacteria bacterium]|nr:tRNA pseudouridine(38-40) synthase TruA [Fusobacteriota bacterium]